MDDKELCEWAGRQLAEQRGGGTFHDDDHPDEDEHSEEAIDMVGHDDLGPVSIEHTLIESFEHQIRNANREITLLNRFEERLGCDLPGPAHYWFAVDPDGVAGLTGKRAQRALDELEQWIRDTAPTLPEPGVYDRDLTDPLNPKLTPRDNNMSTPDEMSVRGVLYRMLPSQGLDGSLIVGAATPEGLEQDREQRCMTALSNKLPKLEASRQPGGVTMLVAQYEDIQLASPIAVARAMRRAAAAFNNLPDHILAVRTLTGMRPEWVRYVGRWSDAALSV